MLRLINATVVLLLALGVLVGVVGLGLSRFYALKFGNCVRFPNGTEIGYEAYIDFGSAYFRPDAVLRTPTGEIISKQISPIHITEKATFGWAWPEGGSRDQDFKFIWTRAFGLVRKDHDPDLYFRLEQDLGDTYFGASQDLNVNTLWFLKKLSKDPRFESDSCNTQMATW